MVPTKDSVGIGGKGSEDVDVGGGDDVDVR
jgi:hypothetical protein